MKVFRNREQMNKYATRGGWRIDDDIIILFPIFEPKKTLICRNILMFATLQLKELNCFKAELNKIEIDQISCFKISYRKKLVANNKHIDWKHDIQMVYFFNIGETYYYITPKAKVVKKLRSIGINGNDVYTTKPLNNKDREMLKKFDLKQLAKEKILDYAEMRENRR